MIDNNPIKMSYIIPHRGATPSRTKNLQVVTDYLLRHVTGIEIIVVEQDGHATDVKLAPEVRKIFVEYDGLFSRSWAFNVGFRAASHDVIAFGDNDLVLAPDAILKGYQNCPKLGTVSPYLNRMVLNLTEESTEKFIATEKFSGLDGKMRIGTYAGGIVFMTREAFKTVGGWDERIYGWGGEDDHMSIKIVRLLGHTYEIKSPFAVHLYHESGSLIDNLDKAGILKVNPHYDENLKILMELQAMSDEELKGQCEKQFELIGRVPSAFM